MIRTQATMLFHRVVPEATFKRRRDRLSPAESEKTERLARVYANARHVWNSDEDVLAFLHALSGGRWNSPGRSAIHGPLSSACAMLETLAHAGSGRIPGAQQIVIAEAPDEDALIERHEQASLPDGWDAEGRGAARRFGDDWLASRRSLVLVVPSVVARLEFNAVANPAHPGFSRVRVSAPEAVVWDRRLFFG